MEKHDTRRKGDAKIKHEVFVHHDIQNVDDDDTPVQNIGDDDSDDFVVRYYLERACRIEGLIKKAILQSIRIKLEDLRRNSQLILSRSSVFLCFCCYCFVVVPLSPLDRTVLTSISSSLKIMYGITIVALFI